MPPRKAEEVQPTSLMSPDGDLVPLQGGATMTMPEFERMLTEAHDEQIEDGEDSYMRIIRQVLSATTPDDVLTPIEAVKARDLVGHALIAEGFEFNQSEFDVGSPFFASIKCVYVGLLPPQILEVLRIDNPSPPTEAVPDVPTLTSGESVVVNCGHKKVLAQLVQLARLNAFPRNVVFATRGRSKVSGSAMLTLLKWESRDPTEQERQDSQFARSATSGDAT
jgi:hypothetical protein